MYYLTAPAGVTGHHHHLPASRGVHTELPDPQAVVGAVPLGDQLPVPGDPGLASGEVVGLSPSVTAGQARTAGVQL